MRRVAIIAVFVAILLPTLAMASDISHGRYHGTVVVTNNGTATANVTVPFSANITAMIAQGWISANLTDSAIRSGTTDIAHMPDYHGDKWWVFAPSIAASSALSFDIYTGGGVSMSSKIAYFPTPSGMTVADNNTSLEPSANFSRELSGYFLTDAGSLNPDIKASAYTLTEGAVAGRITATVAGTAGLQTLAPNGAGDLTNIPILVGAATDWQAQLTNDGDTSYVEETLDAGSEDTYSMEDGTIPPYAVIDSVTVHALIKGMVDGVNTKYRVVVRLGGADTASALLPPGTGAYNDVSFSLGKPGGGTWAPTDIPNLQAGVILYGYVAGGGSVRSTQVYVVIAYHYPDTVVTANSIASGEHIIRVTADGTNLYLYVDGTLTDTQTLYNGVTNNGSNWVTAANGSMPYLLYESMTIGGNPRGYWSWQYGPYFYDQWGGGNTATPTFPTTSSDPDVYATLSSLSIISPAQISSFAVAMSGSILSGSLDVPSQMYVSGNYTRLPGGEVANAVLDASGTPRHLWWDPFLFGFIAVFGMLLYGPTSGGNRTVLIQCAVTEIIFVLLGTMGPIELWPAFLFPIPAMAIISSQKHQSLG